MTTVSPIPTQSLPLKGRGFPGTARKDDMKQISLIILALCLPLLLCAPARAAHSGPYAGVFLGGNALMPATCNDSKGEFDLRFNPGLLGSAVVGWDFEPDNPAGEGRIELEY